MLVWSGVERSYKFPGRNILNYRYLSCGGEVALTTTPIFAPFLRFVLPHFLPLQNKTGNTLPLPLHLPLHPVLPPFSSPPVDDETSYPSRPQYPANVRR